ncbi:uncharacterized protein LOC100186169 [Ciona intestinalis]
MLKKTRDSNSKPLKGTGFLKPTLSYQQKVIPSKAETQRKILGKRTKRRKVKTSLSETECGNGVNTVINSAVEVYSRPNTSENIGDVSSHLDELKSQNKECTDLENESLKFVCPPAEKMCETSEINNNFGNPEKTDTIFAVNKPVIKVDVQRKFNPLQDKSNNYSVYSQLAAESSKDYQMGVIKKLNNKKEKYKRKVQKLESEMRVLKRRQTSRKSIEIPLHEVSFYSSNLVGEGKLTNVYCGTYNGKAVAVKKFVQSCMITSSDRSYISAEAGLLVGLNHRNIVRLYGVSSSAVTPLIITEMVHGKTLKDLIANQGLDEVHYYMTVRDISQGLAFLHNQKPPILHLNIKPSNVLIDSAGCAKVSDYGFAKLRDYCMLGSNYMAYVAPELLEYPSHLTTKIDVYAFAVLLWEMATAENPTKGKSTFQIFEMVRRGERLHLPSSLPHSFHKLIGKCWNASHVNRPSFKEIIIEVETMKLPQDWNDKLREAGVERINTSDMSCIPSSISYTSSTQKTSNGSQVFVLENDCPAHTSHFPSKFKSSIIEDKPETPQPYSEACFVSQYPRNNFSVSKVTLCDSFRRNKELKNPGFSNQVGSRFDDRYKEFVNETSAASSLASRVAELNMLGCEKLDNIQVHSLPSQSAPSVNMGPVMHNLNRVYAKSSVSGSSMVTQKLCSEIKDAEKVLSNAKKLLANSPITKQKYGRNFNLQPRTDKVNKTPSYLPETELNAGDNIALPIATRPSSLHSASSQGLNKEKENQDKTRFCETDKKEVSNVIRSHYDDGIY